MSLWTQLEKKLSTDQTWCIASAPSNIALIKYMGKVDTTTNKPTNSSLSWTLNSLRSFVRIKKNNQLDQDIWSALVDNELKSIQLSETGSKKFLSFFQNLKMQFGLDGFYEIQSANNFPSDCGLASSASSFAALTLVVYKYARTILDFPEKTDQDLALISKSGSGSSCRSFFSPWAEWSSDQVKAIDLPYKNLNHMVILCDETIKAVSSSQAHKLVLTSDLFPGRIQRAEKRMTDLKLAFTSKNWLEAVDICWNEFWDMHNLFHTSKPAFQYINGDCMNALNQLLALRNANYDSPLITMDAGSNIHLLFSEGQTDLFKKYQSHFSKSYKLWTQQ